MFSASYYIFWGFRTSWGQSSQRCLCATGSSQEVEHVKTKWSLRSHSHSLETTLFIILYIFMYLCSPPKWRGCNMSNQWAVPVWQTPRHVNINSSLTFPWPSLLSSFISLISLPISSSVSLSWLNGRTFSGVWQMVVGLRLIHNLWWVIDPSRSRANSLYSVCTPWDLVWLCTQIYLNYSFCPFYALLSVFNTSNMLPSAFWIRFK